MKKTITSFLSPLLAAVFTLSAVFTGITLTADAAGLLVTTENDSGAGSLRHALGYAQAGDIITFASNVITITL
ncbi:MAG: hypothetical protein FWF49_01545, partial [Oscillospiraceae bacterium]|nr:hypothetical protein [Oscillospiraceae bacterium]